MIKIGLAKYNGKGEVSYLENEDTGDGIYLVMRGFTRNASLTCNDSAKLLRELADAFDRLAEMPCPYKRDTHNNAMESNAK